MQRHGSNHVGSEWILITLVRILMALSYYRCLYHFWISSLCLAVNLHEWILVYFRKLVILEALETNSNPERVVFIPPSAPSQLFIIHLRFWGSKGQADDNSFYVSWRKKATWRGVSNFLKRSQTRLFLILICFPELNKV